MAEACSMEAVERNAKLLERSLKGTGRCRLGRSRSQDGPEKDRNHLPSIPVTQVKPFMENAKTRMSAQALSSLISSSGGSRTGKSHKLSPILSPTTTSPVPSPSGSCHAPAMAGPHGMALKGAMAAPREVSELLCYQHLRHPEELQRRKDKRKHPNNRTIGRNLPPIKSCKMPEGDDINEGNFGLAGNSYSGRALTHQCPIPACRERIKPGAGCSTTTAPTTCRHQVFEGVELAPKQGRER